MEENISNIMLESLRKIEGECVEVPIVILPNISKIQVFLNRGKKSMNGIPKRGAVREPSVKLKVDILAIFGAPNNGFFTFVPSFEDVLPCSGAIFRRGIPFGIFMLEYFVPEVCWVVHESSSKTHVH